MVRGSVLSSERRKCSVLCEDKTCGERFFVIQLEKKEFCVV